MERVVPLQRQSSPNGNYMFPSPQGTFCCPDAVNGPDGKLILCENVQVCL